MLGSQNCANLILDRAKKNNYAGQDPFDGLNSRFFDWFPGLKKGIFGLAWIQLHKRLAINLRPLFGIPKKRNPKGIGLFILGLLEDYKATNEQVYLDEAIQLADWLLTQQSDRELWQHSCWGYHFDWNARAFFVPKGKPNVITTIYVAQALYALSEITGKAKYSEPALDSAHFIVKTLYTELEGRQFFGYIPGETAFVHNANLWGAAWVAKVAALIDNQEYKKLALSAARQTVSEQGTDGSWVYGARHHHQFIDGFHTGYNLEALTLLSDALVTDEFKTAIDLGLQYYKVHLFEEDGTAKYYNNNRYPLDMHCVSQAIFTLLKVGKTAEDFAMAEKIINRSIETLYLPTHQRFIYQKNKHFTNKVDYVRWTQAWVYYSFAFFNRNKSNK
ncbi:aspartate-semialdehyde dehydrogenase [Pseudoalteromonas sp. SG45-5]|uniref:aspartate-semialdehyde dehydrogenase n=1 Tax=unclassified Pseudoalteromonas TaxID=194690 RepID=UPI0015F8E8A4|nr:MULTISPECIES: aspartate-semialdehyde dehydrogenase [unclassified Pseudoalteromonas]MBB1384764.1 aspartate-semialdehyde dehydrogenase [Pseudoalteromonas sp. SG45-5]MBB1392585.1 aspartate-semialdehyde dehydrogenase [Pseudoalteromonas sp. SG44-4]MBB1446938.1 aspartate-semialdehyde dehydrogenase [Pseudoalteromonas sp. SG41-6]